MQLSDFDYHLPEELIAQHPLVERDASRMLVLERATGEWHDSHFATLSKYLRANDVLVLNDTRVFPARLLGERTPTGGAVELLLLREVEPHVWEALTRPARRLKNGANIRFGNARVTAQVIESRDNGVRLIRFESSLPLDQVIDEIGQTPLPPYIKRHANSLEEDLDRYQTVYARHRGAIAAPTAGLHFTSRMLTEIEERGVHVARITLHVGYGTFEPVRADDVKAHRVAAERFSVTDKAAETINTARASGGRVVAVGTTTTRALESSVTGDGRIEARSKLAELTIIPGYEFRAVDALFTNFHLPRSSLLMLVSAFAGHDLVLPAYGHAVREGYRFYSYGDCMLIL